MGQQFAFDDDFCRPEKSEAQKLNRPWMAEHKFVCVSSIDELRKIVDNAIAAGVCALDTETEGLDTRIDYVDGKPRTKHQIVGYCLSYDGVTGYYVPVKHNVQLNNRNFNLDLSLAGEEIARLCRAAQPVLNPEDRDPFSKSIVEPPKVKILFWNAQFDQEMLFPVTGIDAWHQDSYEDGMLMCYVVYTDDELSLKTQSKRCLKDSKGNPYDQIELDELFVRGAKKHFCNLSPDMPGVVEYACSDAICTFLLCQIYPNQFKKTSPSIYRMEKQVTQAIRYMERMRIKIDIEEAERIRIEAENELQDYANKICALAESKGFKDFNSKSHQQKSDLLFSERGLNLEPKPEKTESGHYKTDKATLEKYLEEDSNESDGIIAWLVKHGQIAKALSAYLSKLSSNTDEHHQIRVQFKQTGAATGRFSAPAGDTDEGFSGIPIHGIPARFDPKRPKVTHSMRRMFTAREGFTLVKIDFAGQELRIAANVTQEPVWIEEFLHGEGDLHTITARAFFNKQEVTKDERRAGKTANFALLYGGGPRSIVRAVGCSMEEARRKKRAFDAIVPTFAKWIVSQHKFVHDAGGIYTPFGRWIEIPNSNIKAGDIPRGSSKPCDAKIANSIKASSERQSINYVIQGAGADIMKICLFLLYREFHKRRWLESVRMLMTVHDEIVFEIRHEMLQEAMPVIVQLMESVTGIPSNPKWVVPLIVDPSIGLNWEAKYDWHSIVRGRKAKPNEVPSDKEYALGDRIYAKVPQWLEGTLKIDPNAHCSEDRVSEITKPAEIAKSVSPPSETKRPSQLPPRPVTMIPPPPSSQMVVYAFGNLTPNTAKIVADVCRNCYDSAGHLLRVVSMEGAVLIDDALGIRVIPQEFQRRLLERNLRVDPVTS